MAAHRGKWSGRIALPLAVPGSDDDGTYAFVQSWNEFLFGYTFISQDDLEH